MMQFRIRDYVSVAVYRIFLRACFAKFGRRARVVWPLRIVGARFVDIGDDATLQWRSYIAVLHVNKEPPLLRIGPGVQVGNYAHIICTQLIEIGERALIADRVYIADNRHEYGDITRAVMDQPLRQLAAVSIGAGTWIGENVCILGCRIGKNCVVGANSVVTRDLPENCVAYGSPAVPVKRYCEATASWRDTDADGSFRDVP